MKVDVNLKNVIICAPTTIDQNVLAIRGKFAVKLAMNSALPDEEIKRSHQENLLMGLELQVDGFEICICKAGDLQRENFKLVRKREILSPIFLGVIL
jgi:hypothetical protein